MTLKKDQKVEIEDQEVSSEETEGLEEMKKKHGKKMKYGKDKMYAGNDKKKYGKKGMEYEETEKEDEEIEEMTDLASKVPDGAHAKNLKSIAMHKVLDKMGGMKSSEIVDFFNKSMAQIGHEADTVGDVAGKHKKSVAMHPSAASAMQEAVKEDLKIVFGDNEELSDNFKTSMTLLFEAAIGSRVALERADLEEAYEKTLEEELDKATDDLIDKTDEYLSYICEEWIKENEVAIESTLKSEITDEFIEGLKKLFLESYIEVPEDKIDVLEGLAEKVDELGSALNESETKVMKLSEELKVHEVKELVEKKAEGLTPMQADKFIRLAEGVEYEGDVEVFEKTLDIIKEQHFSNKGKSAKTNLITEEIAHDPNEPIDNASKSVSPDMKKWVDGIKRTIRTPYQVN